MNATSGSLLKAVPAPSSEEFVEKLLSYPGVSIERIVSYGHASPEGFWYDQNHGEWVVVIAGYAELEIEGEPEARSLQGGDWIFLPPHCRHRVARTAEDRVTVWLAVHLGV